MTKANLKRLEEGKLYYSISEVCAMTGLEQHVLRYWESEFPQLRPKKNRSGNRAYRAKEIKIIRYIKYLLYEEMFTIPGAKKKMADMNLADLEGQLSLLRVPAAPMPSAAQDAAPVTGAAAPASSARVRSAGAEDNPAGGSGTGGNVPPRRGGGDAAGAAVTADEGAETAARLREELRAVKLELQKLLAALAAAGKGAS